jgi:membrane associated rhomboid family serine protease
MRTDYPQERSRALVWLLCAVIAGFILEMCLIQFGGANYLSRNLVLAAQNLRDYRVWTLLTYSFLHDPNNLLHVLFSALGLFFIGRELLPALGTRRFLALYAVGAVVAGLVWTALNWNPSASLVGASGAICAFFVVFACLFPERPITVLFLFIPVTFPKTKYLAWTFFALDFVGLVFFELPGHSTIVAHSAHLGGMLAGLVFYQVAVKAHSWRFTLPWRRRPQEVIPPAWVVKQGKQTATPAFQVNLTEREHLKLEVDRILDKINSKGFGSLTPEERKTLDEARDMLSKH